MVKTQTAPASPTIPREKFVSFVSRIINGDSGNPDPDNPLKPGPWDPVIRQAVRRVTNSFAHHPYHARFAFSFYSLGTEAGLNPQPLPPRETFAIAIAQDVIERVILMQDIADAIGRNNGQERGIIIVSGAIQKFIDDYCGTDLLRLKFPLPPPKKGLDDKLSAFELVAMGIQFEQGASTVANHELAQELRNAGAKLTDMGLARIV